MEILEATVGEVLGANLFVYCENNPVMYVDPTGKIKSIYMAKLDYIYYQYANNVRNIQLGTKGNIGDHGCEVVAIYNVMIKLGLPKYLTSIIDYVEQSGMLYLKSGKLGTNPYKIYKYLDYCDLNYKKPQTNGQ